MKVTDRDRRLIAKLAVARWLTTRQMSTLCFPGLSLEMARRRIRVLREARYIRSVQTNAMAEALHTLGPRAMELLAQERAAGTRLERAIPRNLTHLLGVNDIRIAVERTWQTSGVTLSFFFASWELQAHGWKLPLIPDATCRVQRGADSATAIFEYDRGEERPSYLHRTKFARYREGFSGFQFSRVVVVAETTELQKRLQAYFANRLPSAIFSFIARQTLLESWSVADLLL